MNNPQQTATQSNLIKPMETVPKDGIVLVKLRRSDAFYEKEKVLAVWNEGEKKWLEIDRDIQKGYTENRYQQEVYYNYLELDPIEEERIEGWISALVPNDFDLDLFE